MKEETREKMYISGIIGVPLLCIILDLDDEVCVTTGMVCLIIMWLIEQYVNYKKGKRNGNSK